MKPLAACRKGAGTGKEQEQDQPQQRMGGGGVAQDRAQAQPQQQGRGGARWVGWGGCRYKAVHPACPYGRQAQWWRSAAHNMAWEARQRREGAGGRWRVGHEGSGLLGGGGLKGCRNVDQPRPCCMPHFRMSKAAHGSSGRRTRLPYARTPGTRSPRRRQTAAPVARPAGRAARGWRARALPSPPPSGRRPTHLRDQKQPRGPRHVAPGDTQAMHVFPPSPVLQPPPAGQRCWRPNHLGVLARRSVAEGIMAVASGMWRGPRDSCVIHDINLASGVVKHLLPRRFRQAPPLPGPGGLALVQLSCCPRPPPARGCQPATITHANPPPTHTPPAARGCQPATNTHCHGKGHLRQSTCNAAIVVG